MAKQEEDYILDPFDDGTARTFTSFCFQHTLTPHPPGRVGERLAGQFEAFVKEYGERLHTLEQALDDSRGELWDPTSDPLALSFKPYEQTRLVELIKTDNKLFNKILIVFSSLCVEMCKLTEEVWPSLSPASSHSSHLQGGEKSYGTVSCVWGRRRTGRRRRSASMDRPDVGAVPPGAVKLGEQSVLGGPKHGTATRFPVPSPAKALGHVVQAHQSSLCL
jgi:hypothetical protein